MQRSVALALVVLLASASSSMAASILVYPMAVRSHTSVFLTVAAALSARGHNVTVLLRSDYLAFAQSFVAKRQPGAQLNYISYLFDDAYWEPRKRLVADSNILVGGAIMLHDFARHVDAILSNATLMVQLRAQAATADLALTDSTGNGFLLAAKLGLPYVDLETGTATGMLFEPILYGAAATQAFVPSTGSHLPSNGMNLLQRAANLVVTTAGQLLVLYNYRLPWGGIQSVIRKHNLPLSWPYLSPLLLLVNSNWATEAPRPVAPQTKYIGPLLPTPAAPLPADLEAWLSGASGPGAVYVSFGSSFTASSAANAALAKAMAALPHVRFIWKLDRHEQARLGQAALSALPNVLVREWVPQNDLLGHPKIRAFLTQGGYLSLSEAAFHGVPILGVPLVAGQSEMVRHAADQGRGLYLHKGILNRGDHVRLTAAINRVLTEPSFLNHSRTASLRLRAHPTPYSQQAADWVEYAVRISKHGAFLWTQGQKMEWYQLWMLDVVALFLTAAAAVLAVAWKLVQHVLRRVKSSRCSSSSSGGSVTAVVRLAAAGTQPQHIRLGTAQQHKKQAQQQAGHKLRSGQQQHMSKQQHCAVLAQKNDETCGRTSQPRGMAASQQQPKQEAQVLLQQQPQRRTEREQDGLQWQPKKQAQQGQRPQRQHGQQPDALAAIVLHNAADDAGQWQQVQKRRRRGRVTQAAAQTVTGGQNRR